MISFSEEKSYTYDIMHTYLHVCTSKELSQMHTNSKQVLMLLQPSHSTMYTESAEYGVV